MTSPHPRALSPLPVDDAWPALLAALQGPGVAVLVAPPGAGKTTRVPPWLRDALRDGLLPGAARDGTVIVLQPRRLAARATAARMAAERGGHLGGEVGYAIRFERRVSPATRIEVVTEGLLLRRLQRDPFLEGVAAVVLDELHERSADMDLTLAMLVEARRELRPDLRLVAMSATLDAGAVAALLASSMPGDTQPKLAVAPVITVQARSYPVDVRHDAAHDHRPIGQSVLSAVVEVERWLDAPERAADRAAHGPGHVLVFLPGMAEIRACSALLQQSPDASGRPRDVRPLHGALPVAAQDAALAPSTTRKIVLSTNVAETSLTVDGVAAVIDSGLARRPRLDPALGLERLELGRISRASADQRAGRAGRQRPGFCRRLWTLGDHAAMDAYDPPEIATSELSRVALQVRAWGSSPERFGWLEAPPAGAIDAAEALLRELGALEDDGLTPIGRAMAELPLVPRLARVLIEGIRAGDLATAAAICALASERDIFSRVPVGGGESDLELRLTALADAERNQFRPEALGRWGLDPAGSRRVVEIRDALRRAGEAARDALSEAVRDGRGAAVIRQPAAWLLRGFPDRVARRRAVGGDRLLLASGRGAQLAPTSVVRGAEFLVAVVVEPGARGERAEARVPVAVALDPTWLPTREALRTRWDGERLAVSQTLARTFGAIVVSERPAGPDGDPEAVAALLVRRALRAPERALALRDEALATLLRIRWLAAVAPELELPTFAALGHWVAGDQDAAGHGVDAHGGASDDARAHDGPGGEADAGADADADDASLLVLAQLASGRRSFAELARADASAALVDTLSWPQRQALESMTPTRLQLPSGFSGRLAYRPGEVPTLSVRLQDAFGLDASPRVGGGRVAVRVELLAPNGRPAAVTSDLAGFWRGSWLEVRKELRGRYPKHSWPEVPSAELARRPRPPRA